MKIVKFSVGFGSALFVLALLYFFPWRNITWGKIVMGTERTVTVSGYAESQVTNQIAEFSAGVNVVNDQKEKAVEEVNAKISELTKNVKDFGIDEQDIQTQSVSVYQQQEYIERKTVPGQWGAGTTIVITLRDVTKASALTDLLTRSGATNVYGPSFRLDTSKKNEDGLTAAAMDNARLKAEEIARAGGAKLDKVVSVIEGESVRNQAYPMYALSSKAVDESARGAALETGSTTVSKTVTVVWSLK